MKETSELSQFWKRVYQNFKNRADASKDLVDAISGNTSARSVVELSLDPCFRREYTSLYNTNEKGAELDKAPLLFLILF